MVHIRKLQNKQTVCPSLSKRGSPQAWTAFPQGRGGLLFSSLCLVVC